MARVILIVLLFGAVVFGVAVLVLGAFPPQPHVQPIERVVPNDHFHSG